MVIFLETPPELAYAAVNMLEQQLMVLLEVQLCSNATSITLCLPHISRPNEHPRLHHCFYLFDTLQFLCWFLFHISKRIHIVKALNTWTRAIFSSRSLILRVCVSIILVTVSWFFVFAFVTKVRQTSNGRICWLDKWNRFYDSTLTFGCLCIHYNPLMLDSLAL